MQKGFTLVELAIVIVIIGIITAATMGARNLIKSANISQSVSKITKMQTAIRAFELEFSEKPGLLKNAYDYWGEDCGTDSDNIQRGCNGNNNDLCINNNNSTACQVTNAFVGDMRRFFVHLNLSGIYPDIPFVIDSSADTECIIGKTIPEIDIGGGYWVASRKPRKAYIYLFSPFRFNHIGWGCTTSGEVSFTDPRSAKLIDEKLDDGNGRRGIIRAITGSDVFNSVRCMDSNGQYDLSRDTIECNLRIEIQ